MTPHEFAAKWAGSNRAERAAAQEHFIDLCRMLGYPTPNEADPDGDTYAFEKGAARVALAAPERRQTAARADRR